MLSERVQNKIPTEKIPADKTPNVQNPNGQNHTAELLNILIGLVQWDKVAPGTLSKMVEHPCFVTFSPKALRMASMVANSKSVMMVVGSGLKPSRLQRVMIAWSISSYTSCVLPGSK